MQVKLLALDPGERRVGVAVSDPTGLIATPLAVIQRTSKAADFRQILGLIREQQAEALIVGHPLNADGSAGPQARRAERYAAALAEALRDEELDLPIILWDEHGSTLRAREAMIASGRGPKDRRERVDAVAAAIILQDYLDVQRPPSAPLLHPEDE
jgi:putative Holliday junction resolvase